MSATHLRRALTGAALAAALLLGTSTRDTTLYGVWIELDAAAAASSLPAAVSDAVRARRGVLDTDRPINPQLVRSLEDAGATVRHASRWLRAVAVDADAATLRRIRRMPEVTGIRAIREGYAADGSAARARRAVGAPRMAGLQQDSAFYGGLYPALRELNIPVLHEMGYTGDGIRIAILDTGFNLTHEALADVAVGRMRDFINRDNNVANEPGEQVTPNPEVHGTRVWSLLGGHQPGQLVAGAYGATYYLAKVDVAGSDSRGDEDRWVAAVEWADSLGVHIINSSIGFRDDFVDGPPIPYGTLDGNTTTTTRMADEAARRGMLVVVAIGNGGPNSGTLWAPADADSVISVGGVDSLTANRLPVPLDSSARGPTADNRLKPELSARGANLVAASAEGPSLYDRDMAGSSYAAPLISSAAAVFMDAWAEVSDLSIMAVRRALMLAGTNATAPNIVVGFGVPDVAAAVMFPEGLDATSVGATDLDGNLTTIGPSFLWNAQLVHPRFRPIRYRIEVATDALFQNIVYTDTVSDAFAHTARRPLRPTTGFWRVVATSPQGVRRTTEARPITVPSWVRLLSLNDAQPMFISETRPVLEWRPLAAPEPLGPFIYDVDVLTLTGQVVQRIEGLTGTSSVRVPSVLTPNESYRWRVIARSRTGQADTVTSMSPFVINSDDAPPATLLYNPFPNPLARFGDGPGQGMSIWFDLAEETEVELAVYDNRGRLVRRLIPGAPGCGRVRLPARLYGRAGQTFAGSVPDGCALTHWDGMQEDGSPTPRGVYVVRLRAGGVLDSQRIIVMPSDFD
ncbi:MAG TPA: S8 family serine peptidase [Longimicrobiales bacterium]|nr:S8 family serine peptidase [Longimicrobiales bacterium]